MSCTSHALVIATVGVGTVLIPYFGVAITKGGGGYTKVLVPQHDQCNLHTSSSFLWLSKNFHKSKSNFKWVTNIFSTKNYSPHYDMHPYKCPHCSSIHLMNPTSVVALCKTCTHLQNQFIDTWPANFRPAVRHWFFHKALEAEKTHFIRSLIPSSLVSHLCQSGLPSPLSLKKHSEWQEALLLRTKNTSDAISNAIQWTLDHPPAAFLHSRGNANHWGSGSKFSTSFSRPAKRPLHYHHPEPLPKSVKRNNRAGARSSATRTPD